MISPTHARRHGRTTVTEPPHRRYLLPPVPHSNSPLGRFTLDLRKLREASGNPSFQEMSRRTRKLSTPTPASSLHKATLGNKLPSLELVLAFVSACLSIGSNSEHEALSLWSARWEIVRNAGTSNQSVVVTGDGDVHVQNFYGKKNSTFNSQGHDAQTPETLAARREDIYLSVLRQKVRHSELNHWMSVVFIMVGVAIFAAGPIVALVRSETMPLLVSLYGVPFAVIGGLIRWHIRRNDYALDSRIDRIEQKIDEDDIFEKVIKVTSTIDDPQQRDQTRRDAVRWLTASKTIVPGDYSQDVVEGGVAPKGVINQDNSPP